MTRTDELYMLDVGSGHNPHPNADVLADAYLDNRERADDAIMNRPFVQADIENLPFKDDTFDFVNASQVVEHTENPYAAISELQRVSQSGQVDTPSYMNENFIFGQDFHNYVMISFDNSVYFLPSTKNDSIMHDIWQNSKLFRVVLIALEAFIPIRISRYYWGNGKKLHYEFRKSNAKSRLGQIYHRVQESVGHYTRGMVEKITYKLKSNDVEKTKMELDY